MDFAEAADDRFVTGRMPLDDEGRVFHGQLAEDVEQPLLVALLLGFDGQPGHRSGKFERRQMDMVLVVTVVQYAVEVDFIDLGDGADVARQQRVDFDRVLALQLVEVGDLERPLAVADEKLGILPDRALMDAKNADLAQVGIGHHLEDVGQHVFGGIRLGLERLGLVARLALVERRRITFGRVRRERGQHVQQFLDPGAGLGRGEQDGNQMPFAQRLLERRMQGGGGWIGTIFKILGEQVFIFFDDLVDERPVRRGD